MTSSSVCLFPDIATWVNLHDFVNDHCYFEYRSSVKEIDVKIREAWNKRVASIDVPFGSLSSHTLVLILRKHPMTRLILMPEQDSLVISVPIREPGKVGPSQ